MAEQKPDARLTAVDNLNRCISRVLGGYTKMNDHTDKADIGAADLNELAALFQRQGENATSAAEHIAALKELNATAAGD